jgi:hypothetical protein
MIEVAGVRYKGDLTAGALKVAESRLIARLLLCMVDDEGWKEAIVKRSVLQARNPATAKRLTMLAHEIADDVQTALEQFSVTAEKLKG